MAGFIQPLQPKPKTLNAAPQPQQGKKPSSTNTRVSLWPTRWPAIALQACVDLVEAAPAGEQTEVKSRLPCSSCPESGRCLAAKRKEIGPVMYDRELNTTPRASGSSLFPMELFEPCLSPSDALVPFWRPLSGTESYLKVVQAWDLAWSERIGGDWLVCMTGLVDLRDGSRKLLDINRWRQISFDDQVKLMSQTWQAYGASIVVIESDAAQSIWSKHIGRNTAVPVLQHSAGDKANLSRGVPALLIDLNNRKWTFPSKAGTYHQEHFEAFLTEIEAFSWVDGSLQGVGEHDDTVMCWWHLSWGMDKYVSGGAAGEMHRGVQDGVH